MWYTCTFFNWFLSHIYCFLSLFFLNKFFQYILIFTSIVKGFFFFLIHFQLLASSTDVSTSHTIFNRKRFFFLGAEVNLGQFFLNGEKFKLDCFQQQCVYLQLNYFHRHWIFTSFQNTFLWKNFLRYKTCQASCFKLWFLHISLTSSIIVCCLNFISF